MATKSGEATPVTLGTAGLMPHTKMKRPVPPEVGRPLPLAKKTRNLGFNVASFGRVFPSSPVQLAVSHLFPNQCPHSNIDILGAWELNLHHNSANQRMKSCMWFSAIAALRLQETRVSFRRHRAALRSFLSFDLGIRHLSSSLYFTTLPRGFRSNQSTSLHS